MSSTRKKLKRLFKKPSTTASEAFAPRDLDRTPREFDKDGRPVARSPREFNEDGSLVDASLAQSATSTRTTPAADRSASTSVRRAPSRPAIEAHSQPVPTPPPPPSKARSDAGAQPHAHHTAPWAAHAAFDSWKQQQGGQAATEHPRTPPAQTVTRSTEKPPNPDRKTVSKADTPPERASATSARSKTLTSPPGHVHRVDAGADSKRVSMQASRDFRTWKNRREKERAREHEAPQVTTREAPQTPKPSARKSKDASSFDARPAHKPTSEKKKLPKDRVRRRAIRSKEAFLPEHARQYELKDAEHSKSAQPSPPSKAGVGQKMQKPNASKNKGGRPQVSTAPKERKLTMRTTVAPTAQTPAERLMWISAHQQELSDEHIISTLSALEDTALRAGHEARRLRMLSESLLRLERNDDALEALHALQAIVPHDAWTLLRLAEACATRADMMEAGLRWCDDALRLHPWLSQAQTLRDEIEARLQKLN